MRKVNFLAITLLYLLEKSGQCSADYSNDGPSQQPQNPCATVLCVQGTQCWYDPKTGKLKGCENACKDNPCPKGYSCQTVQTCSNQTCKPTYKCTPPSNPCARNNCKEGEFCWYDSQYRQYCENPCDKVKLKCKAGYRCRGDVGICGNATCPPRARCASPCEYVRCPANTTCYSSTEDGRAKCENACLNQSQSVKCKAGEQCVTKPGPCNDYSCPPVASCQNPCDGVPCKKNELCWFDGKGPTCTDPCTYTSCFKTFQCRLRPGSYRGQTTIPQAGCYRKYPPTSCDQIDCRGRGRCTLVSTVEYPVVPICGPNPCINPRTKCCDVRTNGGKRCETNGCYLKFNYRSCRSRKLPCEVQQVCLDPCRVEKVQCPVGTFCYTDRVQCFAPPCNPITTCRQPCNATYGSVCYPDQECQPILVSCKANSPYCKPLETCVKKKCHY